MLAHLQTRRILTACDASHLPPWDPPWDRSPDGSAEQRRGPALSSTGMPALNSASQRVGSPLIVCATRNECDKHMYISNLCLINGGPSLPQGPACPSSPLLERGTIRTVLEPKYPRAVLHHLVMYIRKEDATGLELHHHALRHYSE